VIYVLHQGKEKVKDMSSCPWLLERNESMKGEGNIPKINIENEMLLKSFFGPEYCRTFIKKRF
jgi:hypothetical protein